MTHSKSPSITRQTDGANFEHGASASVVNPGPYTMAKSPVKIAVRDLMLGSASKALQDRLYSHEVQPGDRVLARCLSSAEDAGHGQSQSLKKRRRTAAERAEQRSMKSSLATLDDRASHRNVDKHPQGSAQKKMM